MLACKQKGDSHTTCNGNKGLSVTYNLQARNRMGLQKYLMIKLWTKQEIPTISGILL